MGSMLQIQRRDQEGKVTLHVSGTIDLSTVLRLRDVAFSVIGERPTVLCLDLRMVSRVEITGINTLVTIGRVARLVKVCCIVLPSQTIRETLIDTGLNRLLPCADEATVASYAVNPTVSLLIEKTAITHD